MCKKWINDLRIVLPVMKDNMKINQILENEKITSMIDNVIQRELRYDTDNITNDGWTFLEEECPKLIAKEIASLGLDEDEIDDISKSEISNILQEIISEYEQTHANIRYY